MNEIQAIVEAWEQLRTTGAMVFLATVVRTEGSTYRRAGARMLFTESGWVAGSISGGCLEADMLQTARQRTEHGPMLVTYDSSANEDIVWGFGLGCNGVVETLLERLTVDSDVLAFLQICLHRREPGVIATVLRTAERTEKGIQEPRTEAVGDRLMLPDTGEPVGALVGSALLPRLLADAEMARQTGKALVRGYETSAGRVEVGFEVVLPPRPLVIFGAGQDALPVVRLAKATGWHVTVVDPRSTVASAARFALADTVIGCTPDALRENVEIGPETFTLLMTHNFLHDAALLEHLLASAARYIGVLGPQKRLNHLREHLEENEIKPTVAQWERVHGPVGLDIGADNPEEIALSIVAELQAVAANRTGGMLRERQAPLHASFPQPAEPSALTEARRGSRSVAFSCPLSESPSEIKGVEVT